MDRRARAAQQGPPRGHWGWLVAGILWVALAGNALRASPPAVQQATLPWWVRASVLTAGCVGIAMACRRQMQANWRITWLALGTLVLSSQAAQSQWIGRLPALLIALCSAAAGAIAAFVSATRPRLNMPR